MLTRSVQLGFFAFVTALFSHSALAQDRVGPVEQCLARVAHIAESTARFNREVAENSVASIHALDREGAPDAVIVATGHAAKHAINRRSQNAKQRVRQVVSRCVALLRENDAPARVIMAVIVGGQHARDSIDASSDRAKHRITHAVQNATD